VNLSRQISNAFEHWVTARGLMHHTVRKVRLKFCHWVGSVAILLRHVADIIEKPECVQSWGYFSRKSS
jgi:hypothetical protein